MNWSGHTLDKISVEELWISVVNYMQCFYLVSCYQMTKDWFMLKMEYLYHNENDLLPNLLVMIKFFNSNLEWSFPLFFISFIELICPLNYNSAFCGWLFHWLQKKYIHNAKKFLNYGQMWNYFLCSYHIGKIFMSQPPCMLHITKGLQSSVPTKQEIMQLLVTCTLFCYFNCTCLWRSITLLSVIIMKNIKALKWEKAHALPWLQHWLP